MRDVTASAMDTLMKHAPVWAASMAGRTKVFISDETPTAHVTGRHGRFKIVINPKMESAIQFVLMHEVAHIFRQDLKSMQRNKGISREINIAADCIINDSLLKMGIYIPNPVKKIACWGQDIYKMDCSEKSINDLMKINPNPESEQQASAPSDVTPSGEKPDDVDGGEEGEGAAEEAGGVGDDFSGYIGLGGGQVFNDPKQLARSVVAYARRMFFETGFKSKNMSTKNDWRRNRSAFATRTDVCIPRTTVGEYGHDSPGPLVNLVLDTSGSMDPSWVSTASTIAKEIGNGGLDYDLWLTPSRRKARDPRAVLDALLRAEDPGMYLHEQSNAGKLYDNREKPYPSRAIRLTSVIGSGANELREIAMFNTEDPVVWIYIGDYCSSIDYELFLDKNFLHVPMVNSAGAYNTWTGNVFEEMKRRSLPRWVYTV